MGDIQAVLDLAKRLESESDDDRMKRISSGKMNMEDFLSQLEEVTKMGFITRNSRKHAWSLWNGKR